MIVSVALFLDEDLTSNLTQHGSDFTELVSYFLAYIELLIFHGDLLLCTVPDRSHGLCSTVDTVPPTHHEGNTYMGRITGCIVY
jgi:hypothetical protein